MITCGKQVLRFYIAETYINCKGQATVSFLCSENNINGQYLSSDFNNEHIRYFDSEKEALEVARCMSVTQTVHGHWMDA